MYNILRTYLVSYSAELDAAAAPGILGALSPLAAILLSVAVTTFDNIT